MTEQSPEDTVKRASEKDERTAAAASVAHGPHEELSQSEAEQAGRDAGLGEGRGDVEVLRYIRKGRQIHIRAQGAEGRAQGEEQDRVTAAHWPHGQKGTQDGAGFIRSVTGSVPGFNFYLKFLGIRHEYLTQRP